ASVRLAPSNEAPPTSDSERKASRRFIVLFPVEKRLVYFKVLKVRRSISSVFAGSNLYLRRKSSVTLAPNPAAVVGYTPLTPRFSPPTTRSLKTGSSFSKNSRIKKFGIEKQRCIEASVQRGPFGLCGATGM